MQIDVQDEGTVLDMWFCVKKLLAEADVKLSASPGNHNLLIVNEDAQRLNEEEQKYFHSTMANLLYLAKRARPDILTVVIFLCTQVQYTTVEDREKLERVLGYIKGTQDKVLLLCACIKREIAVYVDAAYALHQDSFTWETCWHTCH
jgi:hypothetical protein